MPNVLKVFLENGQTKSFKYDNKTTVKDVVQSLQEKLNISCGHHFCLVLQNMKSTTPGKMVLLQEGETLAELAARPGARHFRCLFRVAYVPRDAYELLKEDPISFEYFYMQCCNDVVHERFASEMKYDTALRLAALHIQQHAVSNNMAAKISIKAIEKESGLDKFVAHSLLENMKPKDLRKMLAQYLKLNQNLTAPGQKQLTALQAKLHYMKIVSELKTFGSRVFMVTLLDQRSEAMVLVGPRAGVSVVTNIKSYTLSQLADFDQIENLKVTKEGENMHRVDLSVKVNNKMES
ncbi:FERM and PDZ domain-containing protein 4, partial [Aplysia californica]|uniref:FERM and PDZ domain-containing protein 4 n=1 Tax=Aplysia californica TaxID=6500 RepID=A0ABM1A1S5_APLCA